MMLGFMDSVFNMRQHTHTHTRNLTFITTYIVHYVKYVNKSNLVEHRAQHTHTHTSQKHTDSFRDSASG